MKAALADWVARRSRTRLLRWLGRPYYALAWLVLRAWLRLARLPFSRLWLRRGYAATQWIAGVSDIDIGIARPAENGAAALDWLLRFEAGYRRLRAIFPMLGEVQIGSPEDWRLYLEHGDLRLSELSRAPASQPPEKRDLDRFTEQLHAYALLSRLFFDEIPGARAAAHARKAYLDLLRFRREVPARSRAETEAQLSREEARALSGPLEELMPRAARALIEGLAHLSFSQPPTATDFARDRIQEEDLARQCADLQKALGGTLAAAVHDETQYFILAVSSAAQSPRPWRILLEARRREPALRNTLLVLPPETLGVFAVSPFAGDPFRVHAWAGVGGDGARALVSGAGPFLSRRRLSAWNLPSLAAVAPDLERRLALETATHLAINWHAVTEGPEGLCYLYGRALSLRLYFEDGLRAPSFPLESLALEFLKRHPGDVAWLERALLTAFSVGDWRAHRAFIANQVSALMTAAAKEASLLATKG